MADSKIRTRERWEAEFSAGKWDFLKNPAEQERLKIVCDLLLGSISQDASFILLDLGSGEGMLGDHMIEVLGEEALPRFAHYVPMDIAKAALDGILPKPVAVTPVRASLREFEAASVSAVLNDSTAELVIVANEVLTYDADSVEQLQRIAKEVESLSGRSPVIIVSCVGPHPDKPNWTAASDKLWAELADTGWNLIVKKEVRDDTSGVKWDLGVFGV